VHIAACLVRRGHSLLSATDARLERRLDEVAAQAVAKARKAAAASKVSAAKVGTLLLNPKP
jgi:hypothetical protein